MKITNITARQILDSKATPTVEVDVILENGMVARAAVPSGASTGTTEAVELRDDDASHYAGKGVLKAVTNVNEIIAKEIISLDVENQDLIDQKLIDLDGTENKSKLGANAILGVSMAVCKAAAKALKKPLYQYISEISGNSKMNLPRPMVLLLEGGKHGNWSTDIQEFMIMPGVGKFYSFAETLEAAVKVFTALEKILVSKKYSVGLGFEGAFCPQEISSNEEALQLLVEAINNAGFEPGKDFVLAIDGAASEFFEQGQYHLKSEDKTYSPKEWSDKLIELTKNYPIFSLEDMHQEELWDDWAYLLSNLGNYQIVGDDLVTTNLERIKKAADKKAINSVLIKPNQIGTVTETIKAVQLTHQLGWTSVVSHRGGETNDDFIADFCVGVGSEQCKFGGPVRGERLAKYNQLLRIEEEVK